ncbi:hypothetical protein KJA14_00025 [Patescibacteria group bacterium]|nr:hypothetical protein [Patescibacteria group bacterium]
MLRKIKNYLFNRKLVVIILCFFILVGLFIPLQKAKADLLGIIDTFNAMFEGIEEKAAPLAKQIITVFVTYIVGLVALYTSSNLLQLAIVEQSNWLTIQLSPIVQAGWSFISGLANLFLILIFVAIAIAYILKIETFQAKKALPRLIIVALLLNFSLVFIGALVDISNILYNTVLQGNENLILQFIDALGAGGWDVVFNLMLWIALLAGLFIIPVVGPFAQLGLVILMVGVAFLPNIVTWIFQIVLFLMVSGVFFTWTFLFAARVFVIQILAILAPLAFVCMILPQTRKYWDEWLKHLLGWMFLGIFLLFFLVIGLRAADVLVPPGGLTPIPVLGWLSIASYFTYYFFIFIYLILVSYVSSRFMPALATFMITQAKGWGGIAWQRAIKPFGKVFTKSAERAWKEKAEPRVRPWLERRHPLISRVVGGPGAYEAEVKKRTAKERKKIEDRSTEALHKIAEMRPITPEDRHQKAAAMEFLAEKRKLTDTERQYLSVAKAYGADMKKILQARPDWAPSTIDPKTGRPATIRGVMEKMEPREFRRKVQAETLKNLQSLYAADSRQIREIALRGTRAQKDALRDVVSRRGTEIADEITHLIRTGRRREANALHEKLQHIESIV